MQLAEYHQGGDDGGEDVGNGEGEPYAVHAVGGGEPQKQRNQENHLAGEAKENCLGRCADALEQACGYDGETSD